MKKIKFKSKPFRTLLLIALLLSILSLSYNILLLSGIENTVRYLFIALLVDVFFIMSLYSHFFYKKKTLKKVFYFIIIILIIITNTVTSNYISNLYKTLDQINKTTIVYKSNLITLSKNDINIEELDNEIIGILYDNTDIEGNVIPNEMIKEYSLDKNNEIKEYASYDLMIKDLYEENIKAVFVPGNYTEQLKDEFTTIKNDTLSIASKTKEVENELKLAPTTNLTEPFTMLIIGIDSTVSDITSASSNGDSLMLLSFNPNTLNATILSIPRDTYVPLVCYADNRKEKITHSGWLGESCIIKTIENFTDIDIDYYVKVDFKGVVDLVDSLGGIEVDVPMIFCEQDSERDFSNQICLTEGVQTLNGEEALALARHRHTLPTGDLARGLNQQLVIEGILNKAKSITDVSEITSLLKELEKHLDTNMETTQILSFYNVGKNILKSSTNKNIISLQQLYLEGRSAMIQYPRMSMPLYNYVYYPNSLAKIKEEIDINLEKTKPELIKTFSFSINNEYEKEIIGKGITGNTGLDLVPDFYGQTKEEIESWAEARNITINYIYADVDETFIEDTVTNQDIPNKTDVDYVSEITITLANPVLQNEDETTEDETEEATLTGYKLLSNPDIIITIEEYQLLPSEATEGDENDQGDYEAIYE